MRMTSGHDQTITLSDKVVVIPSNTPVQLNAMALHTNPQQWGPDPLAWKPDRGISKASNESSEEHISKDLSSCLLAWADGPRVCPGQKFSQIEVFAVLLRLLKNHRVELVPRPGQTMDHARSYAYNLIQNSVLTLTLQMPMAESLGLRWVER
jgi:cytochrome P450